MEFGLHFFSVFTLGLEVFRADLYLLLQSLYNLRLGRLGCRSLLAELFCYQGQLPVRFFQVLLVLKLILSKYKMMYEANLIHSSKLEG